jgi:MFS family permease
MDGKSTDHIKGLAHYNFAYLWRICLVAAMGGLLFGYDWVVIGGAKPFYEPFFNINTPFLRGFAMSSALFGCVIGALLSGMLTDKFGRKRLLVLSGLLFTVSAIGTGLAWGFWSFISFRVIGGLGIGLASNLSPMYIAEISPAELRGRFVSINQLTIVIGILLAQVTNLFIAQQVPTADQIRILLSSSEQLKVVTNAPLNISDESEKGKAIIDKDSLAAVKEQFPDIAYYVPTDDLEKEKKETLDAQIVSRYLLDTWNGQRGWRWMFGAETVPAFAFFLLMFFIPESPRWLVKYGKSSLAEKILTKLGGAEYAREQTQDIKNTLASEEIARVNFKDLLEPKMTKILALGIFLAVFQQWCGINVIFNYAQEIFAAAGYGVSDMLFNVVITGVVNLVATFIAIYTVDRVGRKALMLIGAGGLVCFYGMLGTGYFFQSKGVHMLILIVVAIGCYAMSLAPVTWVLISEIFPNRIRGAAMSVAVLSLWIACTILTLTFPYLKETLGAHGAFWTFGVICVFGFIFMYYKLPETKGKSLEDIERQLVD